MSSGADLSVQVPLLKCVIISHPGVTGTKTVIWREGCERKNLEEDVVEKWRERRDGGGGGGGRGEWELSNLVRVTEPSSHQPSCRVPRAPAPLKCKPKEMCHPDIPRGFRAISGLLKKENEPVGRKHS